MATKKSQPSNETTEPKPISGFEILEPKTYTAKAISGEFGFDPSGIEKYYYPEACEIYQVCPSVLKSNHLFTETFHELIFLMRRHRMRERCILNEAGLIVRHAPINGEIGKPVLRKNESRLTAAAFKSWFWEINPELIPLIALDAPETVEVLKTDTEIILYSSPIYEEETATSIDGTLIQVEEMGITYNNFRDSFIQQFRNEGKALAAEGIAAMQEEVQEATADFFGAMKKAVKRTK